jgi:DNA-directed RNA polymerase specialized sigma24 family protein
MAQILDCSNDAARSRVAHGKSQLRHLLAGDEETSLDEPGVVRAAEVG